MLRLLCRELLFLVVPPLCVACREPELSGAPLCPSCRSRLVPLAEPRCRHCGAPAPGEPRTCPECRGRELAFEAAWSPFAYDGVCRAAIAALKLRAALPLAGLMARGDCIPSAAGTTYRVAGPRPGARPAAEAPRLQPGGSDRRSVWPARRACRSGICSCAPRAPRRSASSDRRGSRTRANRSGSRKAPKRPPWRSWWTTSTRPGRPWMPVPAPCWNQAQNGWWR